MVKDFRMNSTMNLWEMQKSMGFTHKCKCVNWCTNAKATCCNLNKKQIGKTVSTVVCYPGGKDIGISYFDISIIQFNTLEDSYDFLLAPLIPVEMKSMYHH